MYPSIRLPVGVAQIHPFFGTSSLQFAPSRGWCKIADPPTQKPSVTAGVATHPSLHLPPANRDI
jgi:hypothetical protein